MTLTFNKKLLIGRQNMHYGKFCLFDNLVVVLAEMRKIAVYAGFYAFFGVLKVSAAGFTKTVQGTETKKTVKIFFRDILVTGKIFAICVLKKFVAEFFIFLSLIHFFLPYIYGIFQQNFWQNQDLKDNKDEQNSRNDFCQKDLNRILFRWFLWR